MIHVYCYNHSYANVVVFIVLQRLGFGKFGDNAAAESMQSSASSSLPSSSMRGLGGSFSLPPRGSSAASTPALLPVTKEEPDASIGSEDVPQPINTQYISSTCVLLTYFSGETSENVDEHFSRALSQPSSYNSDSSSSKSSSTGRRWSSKGKADRLTDFFLLFDHYYLLMLHALELYPI